MIYRFILFLFVISLGACSSSLTPFTEHIYEKNYLSERDLKGIQFYLSEDIVLVREKSGSKSHIENGEIIIEDGAKVEKVVIPEGTPGVFLFSPDREKLAISFDEKGEKYLMFGPNPKIRNRYTLLASKWYRNKGMVQYGDKKWWTGQESAIATLMVDVKRLGWVERQKTVEKGRRVN